MSKVIKRPTGLYGAEGLIVSVIAQAADDAIGAGGKQHIADAWAYLGGDWYKKNLELLGLPEDWRPEAVEALGVDEFVTVCEHIRSSNNGH